MGIFDFFKSKEQKEKENLMNDLRSQIFPGGNNQVEQEVLEVRQLLDYKYTKLEIQQTYLHATSMFFIAKDKSEERIVNSILYNDRSVLSKEDAKKLYNFLAIKFGVVTSSNTLMDEQNVVDEDEGEAVKLITIALSGLKQIEDFKPLSNEGKYEVVLFNSFIILNTYRIHYPELYQEVQSDLPLQIRALAQIFKIGIDDEEVIDLANNKMKFYEREFNKVQSENNYLPSKIFSSFYINPLEIEQNHYDNITAVLAFYIKLVEMITYIDEKIDEI